MSFGLGDDLRRVLSGAGVLAALALASPAFVARAIPVAGTTLWWIGYVALAAYSLALTMYVGRGRSGVPGPVVAALSVTPAEGDRVEAIDRWLGGGRLAVRGIALFLVGAAPSFGWQQLALLRGAPLPTIDGDPVVMGALLLGGYALVPAMIVAVIARDSVMALLWPPSWIRVIARAPRRYLVVTAAYLATLIAWWGYTVVTMRYALGRHALGDLAIATVSNLLLLTQAATVGRLLPYDVAREQIPTPPR